MSVYDSNRPSPRILLVEDEANLATSILDRLVAEGYEVSIAEDGMRALQTLGASSIDLVVLDVMLPGGMDGFDICREIRQRGMKIPILMLTARSQVVDRVIGLKLGADDYLTKPFEMIEFLARVEAILRRARTGVTASTGSFTFGDVSIDFRSAEVTREGKPVPLSGLEFKLLNYFIEHRGALVSRDELLDKVWGYQSTPYTRTVDVHVASLRQKLEPNPARPEFIVTVHRLGYKFVG